MFDPLGINSDRLSDLHTAWDSVLDFLSQTFESASSTKKDRASPKGVAGLFIAYKSGIQYHHV